MHKKQGKTTAKSLGLKSVLKVNDDLVISTFGKKEKPMVVEQSVDKNTGDKEYYVEKEIAKFESDLNDKKSELTLTEVKHKNSPIVINVDHKQQNEIGMDYLRFKSILEKEFFEKEYFDNVHIQIAYNLLDLKKIIGLHINDTIYSLANLQRGKKVDLVGVLSVNKDFFQLDEDKQEQNKQYIRNVRPYYLYFDGAFVTTKIKRPDGKTKIVPDNKFNYLTLRSLSLIRQGCAHSGEHSYLLYNFEKYRDYQAIDRHVKSLFKDELSKFNNNFIDQNKLNLELLFALKKIGNNQTEQKAVASKFYEYILYRDNKNLGFNLRTIRENILKELYGDDILSKDIQSIRPKINSILDFYLFEYYQANNELTESIVSKLRESKTDEDKEKIYDEECGNFLKENNGNFKDQCIDVVETIKSVIDQKNAQEGDNKKQQRFNIELENKFDGESCKSFPLLMYLFCKFLDAKEVNELLTSIINKLENIESLIDALVTLNKWDGFSSNYSLFDKQNIRSLINDFRLVKNLSSSKRKLKKAKQYEYQKNKQLYADAINLFKKDNFVHLNDEEGTGLDLYLSTLLTKKSGNRGDKVKNFIESAIIKNRRFVYLIRYADPEKCCKLVHNEKMLKFVLGEYNEEMMPLSQLQKYYNAVTENNDNNCENRNKMIDTLVNELMSVSIEKILGFGEGLSNKENEEFINHQKQVVSLYLTIAYLIVKGIVHTNSLYYIAWYAFARDHFYKFGENDPSDYLWLTKEYNDRKKNRVKDLIEHNIKEAKDALNSDGLFIEYRNKVMHLNICNEFVDYLDGIGDIGSYFDIYQYVVQRWSLLKCKKHFKDQNYANKLEGDLNKYKTYQRNFLKIINLPFAYNLARYKNLTIGDLFNDKYPIPKEVMKEYFNKD